MLSILFWDVVFVVVRVGGFWNWSLAMKVKEMIAPIEFRAKVNGVSIMLEVLNADRVGDGEGTDWVGVTVRLHAQDASGENQQASNATYLETRPE